MTKGISLKDIAKNVGVSTDLIFNILKHQEKEKHVGKEVVKKMLYYGN
jgi:hypothetical protein